jgi:HD-GYP domain-containing protein (c-di-GMP phosphodiesterase class II)
MRTDRPYRDALSLDVAVAELLSNAGKQFDPHVVETFVQMVVPAAEPKPAAAAPAPAPRTAPALIPGTVEP